MSISTDSGIFYHVIGVTSDPFTRRFVIFLNPRSDQFSDFFSHLFLREMLDQPVDPTIITIKSRSILHQLIEH